MIKFFSSNCLKCKILKLIMDDKKIEYELITEEDIYLPIADEHDIRSMPFGEVDGKVLNTTEFEQYIMSR